MSVSSHLNPEPERRLWIIHESLRRDLEWTDVKSSVLAALAAGQAVAAGVAGDGALAAACVAALSLASLFAVLGLSPLAEWRRHLPVGGAARGAPAAPGDSMLSVRDLARYTQMELVTVLDRYLGGGITATQYYEDIVGRIAFCARIAARKRRFFLVSCLLAALAQPALLIILLR